MKTIQDFLNLNFFTKTILAVYVFFIVRLHLKSGLQYQTLDVFNVTILLVGAISLVATAHLIEYLFSSKKLLNLTIKLLFISIYIWVGHYHLRSRTNLDFAVMADNASSVFYSESIQVLWDIFTKKDIATNLVIIALLIFLEIRWKKISSTAKIQRPHQNVIISLAIYSAIMFGTPYSYDEFTSFNQSIYRYYFPNSRFTVRPNLKNPFPYINTNDTFFKNSSPGAPNIFIIMVESFNFNYVHKKGPNDKEITPFFNNLIAQGLFFDNFWGNSVQTARGQLSILCSIPTITRQQVFTHYPQLRLNCISDILKKYNYNTLFFKAYSDIDFDNTGEFIANNGFEHIHAMTKSIKAKYSKNPDAIRSWGWGIQDNFFYEIFFNYLDELHQNNIAQNINKHFFAALTTVSNHQKFNQIPEDIQHIYKNPQNITEGYANSLHLTDEYLKTFFSELDKRDYLKNSIIMILGDHSFPMGEHYSYAAENGFYSENFKTPLLLIWKGQKNFLGIDHTPRSQLDIPPTILDILNISTVNHFVGSSLFQDKTSFIPLIQPYSGYYIGSLNYPFKYMYHGKTKREFVFNLKHDPQEKNNLIENKNLALIIKKARQDTAKILLNDALIKANQIWK